jgi:hypothetical protein
MTGQPRRGIFDLARVIESPFDENAPGADGFGILGHERSLLRKRETRKE